MVNGSCHLGMCAAAAHGGSLQAALNKRKLVRIPYMIATTQPIVQPVAWLHAHATMKVHSCATALPCLNFLAANQAAGTPCSIWLALMMYVPVSL